MHTRFFEAGYACLKRAGILFGHSDIPPEMRDFDLKFLDSTFSWKLIPSTISADDLNQLEDMFGFKYPGNYRDFLQTYHYYELPEIGARFWKFLPLTWRKDFELNYRGYDPSRILGRGLLPIADEGFMDAGFLCLDLSKSSENPPVVLWDHEWIGTESEVQTVFSTFDRMLTAITFAFEQDINFFYHSKEDDASSLARKQELLTAFIALDPDGAGALGRKYWTSFGVTA